MSYCVHCGVELENGTPACPLCKTPVLDPSAEASSPPRPLYPPVEPAGIPKISRRVIFILCAILHLIPALVTLICDLSLNGSITWSGFVLGAAAALMGGIAIMLYANVLRAFGKVLAMGALWSAYTYFVEYRMHGEFRVSFALPLVVYGTLMLAALCLFGRLTRNAPRPLLLIALFLLLAGGFCVLIELWINIYFSITPRSIWSIYPAGTALLLAALLAVTDRSNSLKARLKKKLFI